MLRPLDSWLFLGLRCCKNRSSSALYRVADAVEMPAPAVLPRYAASDEWPRQLAVGVADRLGNMTMPFTANVKMRSYGKSPVSRP